MSRAFSHHHLPIAPPTPTWRRAVLFIDPHHPPVADHDPVAIGYLDGLDALDPSVHLPTHAATVLRPDPWTAVIADADPALPDDLIDGALRELAASVRVDEIVSFDGGSDTPPADAWWAPAMSAAIEDYRPAGQVMDALLRAAAQGQSRSGFDLESGAQLRGMVAWSLRVARRPDWTPHHRGTWEAICADGSRPRLTYDGGLIVAATAGEQMGEAALETFFAAADGQLWWHTEPMDEPALALSFEAAMALG